LQKFPGPRLAAITKYYRGYYEIFCDGGWLDQLEILHERYGTFLASHFLSNTRAELNFPCRSSC
ncbi:hypothetical protein L218DRAFT_874324, partial [Marasmius fiardii PR-910]